MYIRLGQQTCAESNILKGHMSQAKPSSNGFTIVELMVSIVLVGISAVGISYTFISIQNIQRQATLMDTATRDAQSEIESLRNNNYTSLTPGEVINFTPSLSTNLPAGSTGTATVSQPSTDLRRVDASVTYASGGQNHTITISSLIGAIGITQ